MPRARYTTTAIVLHWLIALLLPFQLGLGWYMLSIEHQPGSAWYFALHVSIGITIALMVGLRVLWRATRGVPPLPQHFPPWQAKAATYSHRLLYAALVLLPLTGYLGASFSGEGISYFGLGLPAWAIKRDALKEVLFTAHALVAWFLVALVVVHILAAIKHLMDRDEVFWRMWPKRSG